MREMETVLVVRCVVCNMKREIRAGDVEPGMQPMCDKDGCGGFCVATEVIRKRVTGKKIDDE